MADIRREFHGHAGDVQPGLSDALVGAAIGVLLIYLSTLVSTRILSWPLVGCGAVFVVVMTGFIVVFLWQRSSASLQPLFKRMRGHVRNDPQLGALTRNKKSRYWAASLPRGDRRVEVLIEGDHAPNPVLIAQARELAARFDTLERDVKAYLASEAETAASEDPELAAEIRALQIAAIKLWWPDRPNHAVIEFDGPDEDRYWDCEYIDGTLRDLDYDT